ncbi:MAG: phosphonopyruvate decarboxylase, partial [Clostridia bacterium]|nr:phosphonopyruvate decarboxylase [Clostridia bacterium]
FTGVPDSLLKGLCDELYARYGADGDIHVVAHNEGGAVGLCAGHYLSCGRPALCYMQNSGLGNAVNPLVSLMDPKVYGIPCLLVIGWRGEPGEKDEPQHVKQGIITLPQLEVLEIPYLVLSPDTDAAAFEESFAGLLAALAEGRSAAIVVRKGALTAESKPSYANAFRMTREAAVAVILNETEQDDVIVSTTGKLSRELFELREKRGEDHSRDFLTVGSMGHAGMIALRIAVEHPERTVWCLDGDGAALMHLGSLPLIGRRSPARFLHVVINNGAHETVGGMPVCSGSLDFPAIAKAAGYRAVLTADSEAGLTDALRRAREASAGGPVMIEVRCSCSSRSDLGRPTTTPVQNRDALMNFLR